MTIRSKLWHHMLGLFNIQGCTLHHVLDLSTDTYKLTVPPSDKKQGTLAGKMERLLMLVIDKRRVVQILSGWKK